MNTQTATPKKIASVLIRKIEKLKRDTAGLTTIPGEFLTANPTLDRKEVINRLLQLGLNPATVRTQYQRWHKVN